MTKDDLINFLLKTEIPEYFENESKIVSQIFKYCWDLTPENLYRYRYCNSNSFDALIKDKFLLTQPTLFNDPYDSLLYIDKKKILDVINFNSDLDIVQRLNEDSEFKIKQEELLGKDFINKFLPLKPFSSNEEKANYQTLSSKINSQVIDIIIEQSLKALKQSSLVGCLSETYESILMWSHYADNHKGFVLNYDFKSRYSINTNIPGIKATEFADKKIFPVSYSNQRFDATYYVDFHFIEYFYKSLGLAFNKPFFDKLFYFKILLFKSQEWEYEKEWRIIKQTNIDFHDDKTKIDFISNIQPKEIILGSLIEHENREKLTHIAKDKKIPIFQMELEPFEEKYKLTKREL